MIQISCFALQDVNEVIASLSHLDDIRHRVTFLFRVFMLIIELFLPLTLLRLGKLMDLNF